MSFFSTTFPNILGVGILGIGVDLVDSRRLEKILERYPHAFPARIFTDRECTYAQAQKNPVLSYAKRFAAKEAFAKATGYGIGPLFGWRDIEVLSQPGGQPTIIVSERTQKALTARWNQSFYAMVSLTDEAPYAQAFVLIVGLGAQNISSHARVF